MRERFGLLAEAAVSAVLRRPAQVEAALAGQPRSAATAEMAARLAVEGAEPLAHNRYEIPLMRNLVMRAIRGPAAATS
ncbi:MAG: hypothetical protein AB1635_20880 [Acidobacteriota bacterium]